MKKGALLIVLFIAPAWADTLNLAGGTVSGTAGSQVVLPINFVAGAQEVGIMHFTLNLPPGWTVANATPGDALQAAGYAFGEYPQGGSVTFYVIGNGWTALPPLASGGLLNVAVSIPAGTAPGVYSLPITGQLYLNTTGDTGPGTVGTPISGSVTVMPGSAVPPAPVTVSYKKPDLPLLFDVDYPPDVCTVPVGAGDDLQAKIDQANYGDVLCLDPGATFKGNYILRAKTGNGWITIRTATPNEQLPPPGKRMTPSQAPLLAHVIATASGAAFQTETGAHHYRLFGLELSPDTSAGLSWVLVLLGSGGNPVETPANVPRYITIDRCYLHGFPNYELIRGIAMNSAHTAVIDSWISEVHSLTKSTDADAQAICGWTGPGPFKIVNNYLSAGTEIVMFGGAASSSPDMVPSDIEVRHNYFTKPMSWRTVDTNGVPPYSVKNLFELKDGNRVLVEGNVMENTWLGVYPQYTAFVFQAVLSVASGQGQPWQVVSNITVRNNIIRHTSGGVATCANCFPNASDAAADPTNTMLFENNLWEDISRSYTYPGQAGAYALLGNGFAIGNLDSVTFDHNTVLEDLSPFWSSAAIGHTATNITISNNIARLATNGMWGDGTSGGATAAAKYYPGGVITNNVFPEITPANSPTGDPVGNFYPALTDVGFTDYHGGNGGDYRLLPSSPYKNAATDGKDVGVDMDALLAATNGVTDGAPTEPPSPITPNNPTTTVTPGTFSPDVYPNPWRRDRHAGKQITFNQLLAGGTIKIFTTSGHKVKEISVTSSTMPWNLTNEKGDKVASGIYIYLITDGQGNKAKGKVAVIK